MQRVGVTAKDYKLDPDCILEQRVRQEMEHWDLGDVSPRQVNPRLITAVHFISSAYGHLPFDVQVHVTLYTILDLLIDDLNVPNSALAEFMERMYSGTPQLHPVLDLLVRYLVDMKEYYPPFATQQIIRSTLDFVNSMALDADAEKMALCPAAVSYVTFRRLSNGIGDAYGAFVWDKFNIPDVTSYLQAFP